MGGSITVARPTPRTITTQRVALPRPAGVHAVVQGNHRGQSGERQRPPAQRRRGVDDHRTLGYGPHVQPGGDTQHMTSATTGTNSTTCSFTLPTNAPTGTYSASASYQGDGNYTPRRLPATIGVSTQTPTLSFSTPPSPQTGQSFTVTVTVNGNGSLTPTGTVTWTVTAPSGTNPTCTQSTLVNLARPAAR